MKIFIITMLIVSHLMAITVEDAAWVLDAQTDLDKAFKKAKAEKKDLLLLVAIKASCDWCEKMIHDTLRDEKVRDQLSDVVIVVVDMKSKSAKDLNATLAPTMYFIDVSTKKPVQEHIGYEKAGSFLIDIISAKGELD